jgi:hypothetical protein
VGEGYRIEMFDSVEANRKNKVHKFYKITKYEYIKTGFQPKTSQQFLTSQQQQH